MNSRSDVHWGLSSLRQWPKLWVWLGSLGASITTTSQIPLAQCAKWAQIWEEMGSKSPHLPVQKKSWWEVIHYWKWVGLGMNFVSKLRSAPGIRVSHVPALQPKVLETRKYLTNIVLYILASLSFHSNEPCGISYKQDREKQSCWSPPPLSKASIHPLLLQGWKDPFPPQAVCLSQELCWETRAWWGAQNHFQTQPPIPRASAPNLRDQLPPTLLPTPLSSILLCSNQPGSSGGAHPADSF